MIEVKSKLTVYFAEPFWLGLYERETNGKLEVAKIVFGKEPTDYEVYKFFMQNFKKLRFSPPVFSSEKQAVKLNPKRMQRAITKQLSEKGIGTKAQQALKLQHEQNASVRKNFNKKKNELEKQEQFANRQLKKKEKHKGH